MKKRLFLIITAFCVSFIAMVALSLFSIARFATFLGYSDQVDHTNVVIIKLTTAEVNIRDIDRSERGYMITHDTMYLRFFNNAIDSVHNTIADIERITGDNVQQQNNVRLVKSAVALRVGAARENIAYVDTAHTSVPSRYYFDSRQLMVECSRRLKEMRLTESKLLSERYNNELFYQKLTDSTIKYLLFVFCFITFILFAVMAREFRERMRYQEQLQGKVIDLKRSHSELQEIAYAASHDLQEPLRKIQVFSNMLIFQQKEGLDEESKSTLERINNSANRMQLLITDLMNLTRLTKIDEEKMGADLNKICKFILIDIEEKIKAKNAVIDIQSLPAINGYESQLRILLHALLDNALKFTRDGERPVINIDCETTKGNELSDINPNLLHRTFYKITVTDNGIGFDNKFIAKMFKIFQRLHTQQSSYEGKGIGLAICQRIMANHEGYILAEGTPGSGAKFRLYFPADT